MEHRHYTDKLTEYLSLFGFYQEQSNDLNSLTFKANPQKTDYRGNIEGTLSLVLLLNMDPGKKIVFGQLQSQFPKQEILDTTKQKEIFILTADKKGFFPAGTIMQIVNQVTNQYGYKLIENNINTGQVLGSPVISGYHDQSFQNFPKPVSKRTKDPNQKNKKLKLALIAVITLIVLLTIAIVLVSIQKKNDDNGSGEKSTTVSSSASAASNSVVSTGGDTSESSQSDKNEGVDLTEPESKDIGNILSSQFYFETEDTIFYTCSDPSNNEHIYSKNKKDNSINKIFDGFGWNLVVSGEWLYFAGNPGPRLDGTYNIYRIKTDGSKYEKLNDKYSKGLFFFGDYLYYLQQDENYSESYHLYRLNPDTKETEELHRYCKNAIASKGRLYFIDNAGNLFSYNAKLGDPKVLLQADVKSFIIGQNKIIYIDHNSQIKICSLQGEDLKILRQSPSSGGIVNSLNVYNDRIYFTEYNPGSFDFDKYAYEVVIKSVDFEGKNELEIFRYYSLVYSINIINGRVLTFEQTRSATDYDVYAFVISSVSTAGGDVFKLQN